ncbi:monocarboxylate transporter 13-like isoform X2 [Mercenaria mercenaria]|uniref:monocarboxylate transporter 13-like isoform X2 n=1 Tax=Mercenaria mercenaria TaxID=6596 RepID=UPI00234F475D|nr:monocarboxylate transporter 13-like isoform X2 [Mercenaria mercenaria]
MPVRRTILCYIQECVQLRSCGNFLAMLTPNHYVVYFNTSWKYSNKSPWLPCMFVCWWYSVSVWSFLEFSCNKFNVPFLHIWISDSHGIYILHLPSYSKDVGFNKNNFGTVLMAYGICNIVGKVFYSCLGHHPQVNVTLVYTISLTATGICMGLTPVLLTRTGMLVLAGLVGFFSCVTGALINAVIHTIVGFSRFTDGVGMSLPFKATGNLIGGPMAGFLLTATGNYAISFYLAGVSMILASCLLVHPIVHVWQREKDHRTRNINTVSEMDVENSNKESIHGPEHSIADLDNETMLNSESKFIDLENYERN